MNPTNQMRFNKYLYFKHLQSLSFGFFSDRPAGEQIYRISNDISSANSFVCNTIPRVARI